MGMSVPQYQQSVQPGAFPGARVSTDAPIEAFGGGASVNRMADAASGVAGQAGEIAAQEKKKADQVAHMQADGQAAALETQLQTQATKMRGQDAFLAAPQQVQEGWQTGIQKIRDGLGNDEQRRAFDATSAGRWDSLNKNVQMHAAIESKNFDDQTTQSYVSTSRDNAVQNSYDDAQVAKEVARQKAVLSDNSVRNGIPLDSPIFQERLASEISATHLAVIQNRLDNDQVGKAQAYLDQHKDDMTGQALNQSSKLLERSQIATQANGIWNEVQHDTLADGITPDEAKMEATIRAMPDVSDERKQTLITDVKARAKEELVNRRMLQGANETAFMNQATQMRQSGQSMDDALKLVDKYSVGANDAQVKTKAIQAMYGPPAQSDPQKYISLYDGVRGGTAQKADIDAALKRGDISVKDWESLSKENQTIQQDPVAPAQKHMWETVKENAEAAISDKAKRALYLTAVQQQSQGKPPEEMYKVSQDLLKADPKTQSHFLWINSLPFGGDAQYKTESQKSNAEALDMGTAYQDVGTQAIAAIGRGVQKTSGKDKVSAQDIQDFASKFPGGYNDIKAGTPANNAMQALSKAGKLVTPETVQKVLSTYKDGNVPDGAFKK